MVKLKLWLYWDKEDKKSDFVKLCYESIHKHCEPDFEIIETHDGNLAEYLPGITFPAFGLIQHKADLIRALLLKKYGGLWLDGDTLVLSKITFIYELLEKYRIICAAWEEGGHIHPENGIFAAKPGEPLLDLYISNIHQIIAIKGADRLKWLDISTLILTFLFNEFREDFKLLTQKYASPLHWRDTHKFFQDLKLEDYYNPEMVFVYGYHALFPKEFKKAGRDEILSGKFLISKFVRKALGLPI